MHDNGPTSEPQAWPLIQTYHSLLVSVSAPKTHHNGPTSEPQAWPLIQTYHSLLVSLSAPNMHLQGRIGGESIDTPPSPNRHLVHPPQKLSEMSGSTAPNSVMFAPFRSLCPQTPLTHFVRQKKALPSLAAGFRKNWSQLTECTGILGYKKPRP